jgi:photosystem II stability/assembly factor-like uncharacterized protein
MNTKRLAVTATLGLLGLILALVCSEGVAATPSGAGEWTPLGGPVEGGGQVNALAVHPAIADTVYAAVAPVNVYDSGPSTIYKTTNGAASWTPVYTAVHQVYALGVAGTHVYAGAINRYGEGPSIYASHDSGVSWTPVFSFTGRGVFLDIAVLSADPDAAIAGGWVRPEGANEDRGVVYGTGDGGLTWSPSLTVSVPGQDSSVNAVLIHPFTPTLLLAAARRGDGSDSVIYRSADGGATWPDSFTIPGAQVMSLVAHAGDPQMLYAGTGDSQGGWTWGPSKVFRSGDAGLTWAEVSSDTGGLLAFEPPGTVYAGPDPLWGSTSEGDPGTWALVQDFAPGPQISFDIDLGSSPVALYRGGAFSGVSKSTNGGVDWTGADSGIETLVTPVDIALDMQNPDKLFVAAECVGHGWWMTDDGGGTWTRTSGLHACVKSFVVNPQDSDIVYAGTSACSRGAVQRSEDGGLSFEPVYTATFIVPSCSGGDEQIDALAIAPSTPGTVYAGGNDRLGFQDRNAVVVRSLDNGTSWTEVFTLPARSEVKALAINPADDDVVYAGGQDCHAGPCEGFVYRSTDGGDTWDLTLVTTGTVRSIVIDHWRPNVLYVADDDYWVHKSADGGDGWTVVRPPYYVHKNPSGSLLAIDPNVPSHVYLGGWGYIGETTDSGATWSDAGDAMNHGAPDGDPRVLTVDHGTETQTLYAGFGGVWAFERPAPQSHLVYLPVVVRNY